MGNKEKIDYLLVDIREFEKLVASMRDAEIYPVSFFSQAFTLSQKIVASLHSIETDQVNLFKQQMEEHQVLLKESINVPQPISEKAFLSEEEKDTLTEKEMTLEPEEILPEPVSEISEIKEKTKEQVFHQVRAVTLDQAIPHTVSLNEILQKKLLADFLKAFSLNDRFRFRRELFGGDEDRMNKAIDDLNKLQSYEDSIAYLIEELKWNVEDEAVADFIKLLEKRFL